jgi:4-diphosphocytidyl-2-C-methyl-D-erythritol kinase
MMEETAYAKINLALHVRAREPDGYHRIETLFAFAEAGDRLSVQDAGRLMLIVRGPFAEALGASEDNLVIRAAQALGARYGIRAGAAITLDKCLPVASGIGGGSADAAAALRLLARWWGVETAEEDLLEIARGLGADVPACLRSETARGEGRGDRLVSQDGSGLAGTPLLLVNPAVPVSTPAVFSAWDGIDRGALPIASPLATALEARNDLEAAACSIAPEIGEILTGLRCAPGAILTRMSGSGATCFTLFETLAERDLAADAIGSLHPHWWQLSSRIR